MSVETWAIIAAVVAVVALAYAAWTASQVTKREVGTERMREIMELIQQGAMAFLRREYSVLVWFVLVVAIAIAVVGFIWDVGLGWQTSVAYLTGSLLSASAGYLGMLIATRANARTAHAARTGLAPALDVAFKGGSVMGMVVGGLGLLGVSMIWLIFREPEYVNGFALGASSIALFARVGGGIYTKAADVGADLVGKVEAGIPEDDPRNPACDRRQRGRQRRRRGRHGGGPLRVLRGLHPRHGGPGRRAGRIWAGNDTLIILPLIIAAGGILVSIIGLFSVRASEGATSAHRAATTAPTWPPRSPSASCSWPSLFILAAGRRQLDASSGFFSGRPAASSPVSRSARSPSTTTSDHYNPVKGIAEASKTGTATNIIAGLGVGMNPPSCRCSWWSSASPPPSTWVTLWTWTNSGIYGIALAALGMLSITAITVSRRRLRAGRR